MVKKNRKNKTLSSVTDTLLSAYHMLPAGIVIFNEKQILYINKTARSTFKLTNKQAENLKSKTIYDFILPEYFERIKNNNKKIIQGKTFPLFHIKAKNAKNEVIDLEIKSNAVLYNGKEAIQTIFIDITERVKFKDKLVESEEKFKLITENANDIIYFFTYHPKPQYLYISPSAKRVLGYPLKHYYEDPFFISKHVVDKSALDKLEKELSIKQKKNKLNATKAVFQYISKAGHLVWLEDNYSPIYDDNGKIKYLLGISRDITNEKIQTQQNEQERENYKSLVDGLPIGIFIHENGKIVFGNNAAFKIAGLSPKKDFSNIKLQDFIVPEQRAIALDRIKKNMEGINLPQISYDIINAKKQRLTVIINSTPIVYNGKRAVRQILQDVTQEKNLEKERIRAEVAEKTNEQLIKEVQERRKMEAKLHSIFESTTHLIWTVNRDFELTLFNKNFENIVFENYKVKPVLYKKLDLFLKGKDKKSYSNYWYPLYAKVLLGNELKFERKDINAKGNEIFREVYINPIRNEHGEIIEIACLAHDISENKRFEQQILNQSAKLNAIFESTSLLIWTVNKDLILTSYNKNYFNIVKDNIKKTVNNSDIPIKETIKDKKLQKFWIEKYKYVLAGNHDIFEHKSLSSKGTEIYREIYLYPIYSGSNVIEVSAIAQDITERKKNEQQIIEQSAKLKAIFESGKQLIWTITSNYKLSSFNKNYADAIFNLYGFYPQLNKSIKELNQNKTSSAEPLWNEKYDQAFSGKVVEFTLDRINLDGSKVYRQYILQPIRNENNVVTEVSGIGFDITENKLNEEKIKQSLNEKEVLLKEVHHRVKNNMQVISSILNLQSSYVTDNYASNLLKECQNRIKSMAFIHEALYQNKNFEIVNFSDYISTLARNLLHSYSINSEKIKLILTLDKLYLNLDISIPCGLIINEILSNSLKYAFPDNREGIIFVTLKNQKNKVIIETGDNGIGIPETVDIKNTQSLGLQLVDTLIEQINGKLTLERKKGTKFIIEFIAD